LGYYFTIEEVDGKNEPIFYYEYYPSERNMRVNNLRTGLNSFEATLPYFEKWMESLKKELEIVDLWKLNSTMNEALKKAISYPDNDPIKPYEIEKTTEILKQFSKYLNDTYLKDNENGLDSQLQQVQSSINFLMEAQSRFGRKDYAIFVISFFINIMSTLTTSEKVSREIIKFLTAILDVLYDTNLLYGVSPLSLT
jgi:predicted nucleotide-binding protein (sugar kinase/HSP70/actin superfamily)